MTALIGAWRHSQDIQAIWKRAYPTIELTVYDDDPKMRCLPPTFIDEDILLGMNNSQDRANAAQRHSDLQAAEPLIDPSAIVGERCRIARGCVIAPNVMLLHTVQLGPHVHLNYNVSMTRCHVGAFTTISPGTTICGDVEIGRRCTISAGITIANCVTIGDDVTIGAGAVVLPFTTIPPGEKWLGVSARKVS